MHIEVMDVSASCVHMYKERHLFRSDTKQKKKKEMSFSDVDTHTQQRLCVYCKNDDTARERV